MENKYFNYDLVIFFIRTWNNKKERRPCFFAVVEKDTSPRPLPRSRDQGLPATHTERRKAKREDREVAIMTVS
jgi:hypothetical protein